MKHLKEISATTLRQNLFGVLKKSPKAAPTRVKYKKGDSVILSYDQYFQLTKSTSNIRTRKSKISKKLEPLIEGKMLKPLNAKTESDLLKHLGIK